MPPKRPIRKWLLRISVATPSLAAFTLTALWITYQFRADQWRYGRTRVQTESFTVTKRTTEDRILLWKNGIVLNRIVSVLQTRNVPSPDRASWNEDPRFAHEDLSEIAAVLKPTTPGKMFHIAGIQAGRATASVSVGDSFYASADNTLLIAWPTATTLAALPWLISTALLPRRITRRKRIAAGHCPKCLYNRRNLDPSAPCPECGHTPSPITDEQAATATP